GFAWAKAGGAAAAEKSVARPVCSVRRRLSMLSPGRDENRRSEFNHRLAQNATDARRQLWTAVPAGRLKLRLCAAMSCCKTTADSSYKFAYLPIELVWMFQIRQVPTIFVEHPLPVGQ